MVKLITGEPVTDADWEAIAALFQWFAGLDRRRKKKLIRKFFETARVGRAA